VRKKHKRRARRAARTKVIAYGAGSASTSGAGRLTLRIPASRRGVAALRRARRLRVSVAITFDTGAGPVTHTRSVTVKAAKKRKRR
jgi:hypothetical protein